MSNYSDMLAQIKTILESVTNIGKVYDYERFSNNWSDYRVLFKTTIGTTDQIRAWTITRVSTDQKRHLSDGVHRQTLTFTIHGYMGLDDANSSEKTFQELVESVMDAIDAKPHLGGMAAGSDPSQLKFFDHRLFGDLLCHHAEITVVAWADKQITYS